MGTSDDAEGERGDEPKLPDPPSLRPVPCMECRAIVWVRGNRNYVRCEACEAAAD